jgi:hypothetical protein
LRILSNGTETGRSLTEWDRANREDEKPNDIQIWCINLNNSWFTWLTRICEEYR